MINYIMTTAFSIKKYLLFIIKIRIFLSIRIYIIRNNKTKDDYLRHNLLNIDRCALNTYENNLELRRTVTKFILLRELNI